MYNSYFQWHKPKECEHAKKFLTSSEGVCVQQQFHYVEWTECVTITGQSGVSCLVYPHTFVTSWRCWLKQSSFIPIFWSFCHFKWLLSEMPRQNFSFSYFFSVCRLVIWPPKRSERRHFLHTHLIETWWEFFRESFKWDWIVLGILLVLWGRWRLICDITMTFTPALNLNALRRISLPCSHYVLYKGTPSLSKMCLSDTLTDYSLKNNIEEISFFPLGY